MRLLHKDAIAGMALVILAIVYWIGAGNIPKSLLEGGVGAGALPKLLGVLLLVLSVILVLQTILAARRRKDAGAEAPAEDVDSDGPQPSKARRHLKALGFLLISIGYVVLVEFVGYAPAIAYLLGALVWFSGGASRRPIAPFAVIGAVFFWLLFVEALGIRQPKGFWPDLWKQVSHAEAVTPDSAAGTASL